MSAPFPWPRAVAFATLTLMMLAGPTHNQVLRQPYNSYLKPWRMYYGFGDDLCEARFIQTARNGQTRVLDRYEVLGYADWKKAPTEVRNLPSGPAIGRVARRLCEALPAKLPHIHAEVRCASTRGWQPAQSDFQDLCRMSQTEIRALLPRDRK